MAPAWPPILAHLAIPPSFPSGHLEGEGLPKGPQGASQGGGQGEGSATHRGPLPHGDHHSSQGSEEGPGGNQLLKPCPPHGPAPKGHSPAKV